MLVLSRRAGEDIIIGSNICVTVLSIHGNSVKLGFSAPEDVAIVRSELVPRADEVIVRACPVTLGSSNVARGLEHGDAVAARTTQPELNSQKWMTDFCPKGIPTTY